MTRVTEGLLVLPGPMIRDILHEAGAAIIDSVRAAYAAHASGKSVLPHSVFLRMGEGARVIALPAYVAEPVPILGLKWIGSFLANTDKGLERASSVIVLNSTSTGRPEALLEGAEISAARTAASAALAAGCLGASGPGLGVIGAGRISFEIVRYLRWQSSRFTRLALYDLNASRAARFALRCGEMFRVPVEVMDSADAVLASTATTILATSAAEPHIAHLPDGNEPRTLLHISLRDLTPALVARCRNIVDDVDHICRESTSLDLASRREGHRAFIAGTLSDVLTGAVRARLHPTDTVVFSPFGLGVLDIAVADLVRRRAIATGKGTVVPDFVAPPMLQAT